MLKTMAQAKGLSMHIHYLEEDSRISRLFLSWAIPCIDLQNVNPTKHDGICVPMFYLFPKKWTS